jgi:hypothetical protein
MDIARSAIQLIAFVDCSGDILYAKDFQMMRHCPENKGGQI